MKYGIFFLAIFCFCCSPKKAKNGSITAVQDSSHLDSIALKINERQPGTKDKISNSNKIESKLVEIFLEDTLPKVMIYENDNPISDKEKKALQILWSLKDVRGSAIELAKKSILVYSEREINDSCYEYGIYQDLSYKTSRIATYMISRDLKRIMKYDIVSDKWTTIRR